MTPTPKIVKRYSMAFKQKVVQEIEQGLHSIEYARQLYHIGGSDTIQKWIRKFGKHHLLAQVVMVKIKDEPNKIKMLQTEKQALESALAQAHLKILTLESTIKAAEEVYGVDLKKNFDTAPSTSPEKPWLKERS